MEIEPNNNAIAPDAALVQQQAALVQQAEAAAFQQAAQAHQAHVEQQFIAQQHAAAAQAQAFMAERNEVQALIGRLDQELQATRAELMRRTTTDRTPSGEQGTQIPRSFKIPTPECFFGKKDEDLDGFLHQLEEHFELAAVTSDTTRIRLAALCLRGAARTWYTSTGVFEPGEIGTWERFTEEIKAHFSPLNQSKMARDKLHGLVQDGSVSSYTYEFRTLSVKVTDLSDSERYHRYIGGLKHYIRREIELRPDLPETFEAAARFAEKFDRTSNAYKGDRNNKSAWRPPTASNSSGSSASRVFGPRPMEIDAIKKEGPKHGPLNQEERDRRREQNLCAYCGSDKHLVAECPLSNRGKGGPKNGLRRPQGAPRRQ